MPYLATTPSFRRIPSQACLLFFTARVSFDVIFILSNKSDPPLGLRLLNDNFLLFLVLFVFIIELVLFITAQTIICLSLMQSLPLLLFLLEHKTLYIGFLTRFLNLFFNIRIPFYSLWVKLSKRIFIPFVMETLKDRFYFGYHLRVAGLVRWAWFKIGILQKLAQGQFLILIKLWCLNWWGTNRWLRELVYCWNN